MDWSLEMQEIEQWVHICGGPDHERLTQADASTLWGELRNKPIALERPSSRPTFLCKAGACLYIGCRSVDEAEEFRQNAVDRLSASLMAFVGQTLSAEFVVAPTVWWRKKATEDLHRRWAEEEAEYRRREEETAARVEALKAAGVPICRAYPLSCKQMASGLLAEAEAASCNNLLEHYEKQLEHCECYLRQKMLASIPAKFRHMTLANFECGGSAARGLAGVLDASVRYAKDPREVGWLTLYGQPGVGKTHLAIGILKAAPMVGMYIGWRAASDRLNQLMRQPAYNEFWDEMLEAPLLLVDDIGTQHDSEWSQYQIFKLIDHRYTHDLPTIFTTNWRVDGLDGRVGSRLRDRHNGQVIRIDAPDFRIGVAR